MDHNKSNKANSESNGMSWIKKPEKMFPHTNNASSIKNKKDKGENTVRTTPLKSKKDDNRKRASTCEIIVENKQFNDKSKNQNGNFELFETVIKKFKYDDENFKHILKKISNLSIRKDENKSKKIQLLDLIINNLLKADENEFGLLKKRTERVILSSTLIEYYVKSDSILIDFDCLLDNFLYSFHDGILVKDKGAKKVIVKVSNSLMSFEEEAASLLKLDHSNIIKMLAVNKYVDKLVLELMDGVLSSAIIEKTIDLSSKNMINLLIGIAAGMEYLHSKNIVLRNLSCRTVLVNKKNECKISDINFSVYVGDSNGEYIDTEKSIVVVELPAPETALFYKYTYKTDVWSMGFLCWEAFKLISDSRFGTLQLSRKCSYLQDMINFSSLTCPPVLQNYMRQQVLQKDPDKRSTFSEIKNVLRKM
ncbi:ephrin type-B receptor 1-like [Diorhabda sublineata]|uniref:ephrin type-B receptor 1-like n=1 Tax=Diorhabda sublineata TaxID=1163346 RepID=UPI0024E080EE|nr:ephrin type-B receptor 1-like [Diorhabda sublineata]